MFTARHQLILHPALPTDTIAHEKLLSFLKEIGYIGELEQHCRYQVGEKFLSYTCFLGCSPNIELYPQVDNKPYCYIEVPPTTDNPRFISGINTKPPRCKYCKNTLQALPSVLAEAVPVDNQYPCPACQNLLDVSQLVWRKSACLTRNPVIINNIYESEAVPEQQFLSALKAVSGFDWKYCYVRLADNSQRN